MVLALESSDFVSGFNQLVLQDLQVCFRLEGVVPQTVVFLVQKLELGLELLSFSLFFGLVDNVAEIRELSHPDDLFL